MIGDTEMKKTQAKKSYQELKLSLDAILSQLQHEDTDIDTAITLHQQGQSILNDLQTYLKRVAEKAEIEIKKIN